MPKLKPEVRKDQIITAALDVAERVGYKQMLRKEVADEAKCGTGTVSLHFGTMTQLRTQVMRHAIKRKRLKVIAQGLAHNDQRALKAPENIKREAIATLA